MNVINLRGVLSSRDASLDELTEEMVTEVPLDQYLKSTRIRRAGQEGEYISYSGTNIEPVPLWAITFQTSRRRVGNQYQIVPKKEQNQYRIATADWASEVRGTGKEKEKWRGIRLDGICSPSSLFSVVTSTYLVPYAIGHRYITHLPATVEGKGREASLTVNHEHADLENQQLSSWGFGNKSGDSDNGTDQGIVQWTQNAQKVWDQKRTDGSEERVTDYLNYYDKLARQPVKSYRVVHTRSRKLYAAVLEPRRETALGLPLGAAEVNWRIDGEVTQTDSINVEGVITDNLVNFIPVDTEVEAYWLTGLLNSDPFEDMVMELAKGDPPNIYSIPAKLLNQEDIAFDPDNESHIKMANLAEELESSMMETIRQYIQNEKDVDLDKIDDSDQSSEVPSMMITAYVNRLNEDTKEDHLNEIAEEIV